MRRNPRDQDETKTKPHKPRPKPGPKCLEAVVKNVGVKAVNKMLASRPSSECRHRNQDDSVGLETSLVSRLGLGVSRGLG